MNFSHTWFRSCALLLLLLTSLASSTDAQQNLPSALAPILVEPYDGKDVADRQIAWSWFMQSSADNGAEIFCDLVVVEILDGQTPEEAMRLNPPVIFRENLTTSTWETPSLVRGLEPGRRYAWQITAKVHPLGSQQDFQMLSRSEIWTFSFNDDQDVADHPVADPVADPVVDSLETPQALLISGKARHTFASENRRGNLSGAPVRFDRLQIDPTITLFGVPFDLNFLVSTEENPQASDLSRGAFGTSSVRNGLSMAVSQRIGEELEALERQRDSSSIDSLRGFVSLDSLAIAERIAQLQQFDDSSAIDQNLEALEGLNLLTSEQSRMAQFPSFGFGKVAPNFGSLLFERVTINGGMLEYNPGNLYLAGAFGKEERAVDLNELERREEGAGPTEVSSPRVLPDGVTFFRNVYAARVGYGRRSGSYVALTGLYADDDEQSRLLQSIAITPIVHLSEQLDSFGEVIRIDSVVEQRRLLGRQRNYGFGGVGRFQEKSIGLSLDGEFNLVYFDDDARRAEQKRVPLPRSLPTFLQPDSALTDFNFALRGEWNIPVKDAGSFDAGLRYVGGGFRSVGVAGLRTDLLRADARYRTTMFEQQVRFGVNYSFEEAGYKDSSNSSRLSSLRGQLDLRFKGFPTLALSYQRHDQHLETAKRDTILHRQTDNTIEQFSASVSYLNQWSDLRWSLAASGTLRDGGSTGSDPNSQPDSVGIFRVRSLQVDNRISFGRGFTLGLFGGYSGTRNHPLQDGVDSNGVEFTESTTKESDNYNLDISALVRPFSSWSVTLGAVAAYTGGLPQPAILGGYITSQFHIGDLATIELRFDYRESAAPDLQKTFPVERIGRIITSFKFP